MGNVVLNVSGDESHVAMCVVRRSSSVVLWRETGTWIWKGHRPVLGDVRKVEDIGNHWEVLAMEKWPKHIARSNKIWSFV